MYKKTVKYTDFNGVEREEDFYFNLTAAEVAEMQLSTDGGLDQHIQRIIDAKDTPALIKEFKELLLLSYGEKDPTGKYFEKSKDISEKFSHTEAYSQIFMELATDDVKATEFVNGIMPSESLKQLEASRQDVAPAS